MLAILNEHIAIAELLINEGADIRVMSKEVSSVSYHCVSYLRFILELFRTTVVLLLCTLLKFLIARR
jgi:hypothetical protein